MEWNANGLLRHQHELEVILGTENIDICLISEPHFTKESFIRFKDDLTYQTIDPANKAREVGAIIVRNKIKTFEEEKYVTRDIQATIITIETSEQRITVNNKLSGT
jgi:GTP-sensing pleiotropic transcriptional regulator CodY